MGCGYPSRLHCMWDCSLEGIGDTIEGLELCSPQSFCNSLTVALESNLERVPLPGGEAIGGRGVLGSLPCPQKSFTLWEPLSIFIFRSLIIRFTSNIIGYTFVFPNEAQLRGFISAPLTSHSINNTDNFKFKVIILNICNYSYEVSKLKHCYCTK